MAGDSSDNSEASTGKGRNGAFVRSVSLLTYTLLLLIFAGVSPAPALASDVSYCSQHYLDIDAVYWNTESTISPDVVGTNWSDVEQNVSKYLDTLIARNSKVLVIKTAESADHILSAHPKALYINVIFSYSTRTSFTTPLEHDALVIWVETTRNEPHKNYKDTISSKQASRSDLFLLPENSRMGTKLASFSSPFFFGPSKLLTLESCNVLANSSDKICTDPAQPYKNKIVQQTTPCRRAPLISPEEKDVGKIYRSMRP